MNNLTIVFIIVFAILLLVGMIYILNTSVEHLSMVEPKTVEDQINMDQLLLQTDGRTIDGLTKKQAEWIWSECIQNPYELSLDEYKRKWSECKSRC